MKKHLSLFQRNPNHSSSPESKRDSSPRMNTLNASVGSGNGSPDHTATTEETTSLSDIDASSPGIPVTRVEVPGGLMCYVMSSLPHQSYASALQTPTNVSFGSGTSDQNSFRTPSESKSFNMAYHSRFSPQPTPPAFLQNINLSLPFADVAARSMDRNSMDRMSSDIYPTQQFRYVPNLSDQSWMQSPSLTSFWHQSFFGGPPDVATYSTHLPPGMLHPSQMASLYSDEPAMCFPGPHVSSLTPEGNS